jgi:hypothetical protein
MRAEQEIKWITENEPHTLYHPDPDDLIRIEDVRAAARRGAGREARAAGRSWDGLPTPAQTAAEVEGFGRTGPYPDVDDNLLLGLRPRRIHFRPLEPEQRCFLAQQPRALYDWLRRGLPASDWQLLRYDQAASIERAQRKANAKGGKCGLWYANHDQNGLLTVCTACNRWYDLACLIDVYVTTEI